MSRRPEKDPSVASEPHFQQRGHRGDDSSPETPGLQPDVGHLAADDLAEHSVWDEPGVSPELAGKAPVGAATYAAWLGERRAAATKGRSWAVTLLTALVAGPLAILGTFLGGSSSGVALGATGIMGVVVFGPLLEEVMKNASALWIVESRPYLFSSRCQIAICTLASGAVFAVMENLLYLHVYVSDPSPQLVRWRWTVCVALHMGCALVAGLGTMRIWQNTMQSLARPHLSQGAPYLAAAIVLHGTYNALATLLELVAHPF